tara:strand:+ start:1391 stop:2002 length:612 start_codon:yes stop_codon:yes gene_type:complete
MNLSIGDKEIEFGNPVLNLATDIAGEDFFDDDEEKTDSSTPHSSSTNNENEHCLDPNSCFSITLLLTVGSLIYFDMFIGAFKLYETNYNKLEKKCDTDLWFYVFYTTTLLKFFYHIALKASQIIEKDIEMLYNCIFVILASLGSSTWGYYVIHEPCLIENFSDNSLYVYANYQTYIQAGTSIFMILPSGYIIRNKLLTKTSTS